MGPGRVQRQVKRPHTPSAASRQAKSRRDASVAVPGLSTPLPRQQLRDRPQELWRARVKIVPTACVQFQSAVLNRGSDSSRASVADRLAVARAGLIDVNSAMRPMSARRYGPCDRCHQPLTFDELLATPEKASSARCESSACQYRCGTPMRGVGRDSHREEE